MTRRFFSVLVLLGKSILFAELCTPLMGGPIQASHARPPLFPLYASTSLEPLVLVPPRTAPRLPLKTSQGTVVSIDFGSGLGSFPEITRSPQTRDEAPSSPEISGGSFKEQMGFTLYLKGALMLQRSKWDFTPIELSLIEMRSWATTAERSVSSYARIDGGTRVTWKRQHEVFGTFASHWSAKLHFRRSSFGMVSTAHYVTSPMMSLQMDYFWRFFAWGFGASYGLRPELGFTRAPVGGGAKLPSSQATLQGAFLSGHWLINDTTAFEVTWDYEISQIAFDDTRTDRLFGLALVESQTRRQENLQTVMATMGFKKHL